MMSSYLKFLSRNKLYTVIEAMGLAVSLAFVILIGSYVVQQYQVAHEAPEWEDVYALHDGDYIGLTYWDKEEVLMNIPEAASATHTAIRWKPAIKTGEEVYTGQGMETDADFFDVFPEYAIVQGSAKDFVAKTDVLVSETLARRIGKDGRDLIGSQISVDDEICTIKGVFRDFDRNYFLDCDIITHISNSFGARDSKAFNSIGNYTTWYRLCKGADRDAVEAKIKALLHKNYDEHWSAEKVDRWGSIRMDKLFFADGFSNSATRTGNAQMLRLLIVVVLLLLLSAIFNYVNLSLALTGRRAKEMATRRLLGADRVSILLKYIGESVAFTAVCFAASIALAYLFEPMVNDLVFTGDKNLSYMGAGYTGVRITLMMSPAYIAVYVAAILLLGVICGLLPALAASQHQPIDIIKGDLRRRNKMVLSRAFIIVQNVLTVFLIAMSLVMEMQMRHMLNRPMHSNVDNLYYLDYQAMRYDDMRLLEDKVRQLPFVTSVGLGRGIPGRIMMIMSVGGDEDQRTDLPVIVGDSTYFRLLGFEIKQDFGHPLYNSIWMSESAFNATESSDTSTVFPRRIMMNGARPEYIGGVFADFPTKAASDNNANPNGVMVVAPATETVFAHNLLIGTVGEDPSYGRQILQAFRDYKRETSGFEDEPWSSGFLRELIRKQLDPERKTLRLVELFAVLSIMIALLGLLAMSTYFAAENTKEIAIRKVFGSSVEKETLRAVKSYMLMVLVACAIGLPLAIWAAGVYLQRFAFRIEGYGWVFAAALLISVAIAFATVLWQTLKAARTNPALELKKE